MNVNSKAKEMFTDGSYAFARGDLEKSLAFFSRALEHDSAFELAYLSRGVVHAKLGRDDAAMTDFDEAVEINPNNAKAHHFRGLARMRLGDRQGAVKDFDRAVELDPGYAVAYYSRGTVHAELGDEERAGKDMVMAARLGEANLQHFADEHNIWRTKYDKLEAEVTGERERDWAVTPDLRSWLE